jgi:DNA-binding response OmpR family regulator
MPRHLLIIDDDALMRRSLSFNLEQHSYRTTTAASAEDGILTAQSDPPDLVILDIGLPGMDGLQALREFRDRLGLPVILLTARRRELDEVLGLELGADDYITKPYNLDVLLAHVKAVLRRSDIPETAPTGQPLVAGDLEINPAAHSVLRAGQILALTPREFALLLSLAQNAGRVVSAEDLLKAVWGAEYVGEPQVVYVHMRGLREKIEEDPENPRRIITIRGVGYRLDPLSSETPLTS